MRLARTALLVAMGGLLACGPKTSSKPASFFPESNEAAGWAKARGTRTFPAGDLWQYIDGDAEKYTQAGVEKTLATDYRYQNKIDAVADVYVMGTPEGARKVFESESSEGSRAIQLGDAAKLYGQSMTFRKGPYFVRLVAYEEAAGIDQALVALGRAIESRMGQ